MLTFIQPPFHRAMNSTHRQPARTIPRSKLDPTVYLVTDRRIPQNTTVESIVRAAVTGNGKARATTVQLRDKNVSPESTQVLGPILRQICKDTDTTFIVNDSIALALSLDADGVHLGQDDAPISEARRLLGEKIIGISVGNVTEAERAIAEGADYLGVGAVFATGSKADAGAPIGPNGLAAVVNAVDGRVPVVAIGGINENNASKCREAGANGIAVISAIMQSPSPELAAEALYTSFMSTDTVHSKQV